MQIEVPTFHVTHKGRLASVAMLCAIVLTAILLLPQNSQAAGPSTRVINGTQVPNLPSEWPYIAALVTSGNSQFCGGTLIHASWVLTAAHCGDVPAVIIGRKTLTGVGGERITVASQIEHAGWNAETYENDIQLLQLSQPVTNPTTLELATSAEDPAAGSDVSVAGWGVTESSPTGVDSLREAQVSIISNSSCDVAYGGGYITAGMLCAAHFDPIDPENGVNRDTCQGDSGGPLVTEAPGGPRLAGITSWGEGCATYPFPGVYTRVAAYRDWALGTIGQKAAFQVKSFDFGTQAIGDEPVTGTIKVKSIGSLPVKVMSPSISTATPDLSITAESCTAAGPLAQGQSCSISVRYTATTSGLIGGLLQINTDSLYSPYEAISIKGYGYLPAGAAPPIAPALALAQVGRATKLPRGKIKVVVKAYFIIPSGVNFTTACSNNALLTANVPRVRKAIRTQGAFTWAGSRCVATIKMRMSKLARHRKVGFNIRFAGNSALAPAEKAFKLRIK